MPRPRAQVPGAVLALLLAMATWLGEPRAGAQESDQNFVVGEWAFSRLSKAHEAIGKGQLAEALKILDSMTRKLGLNAHERALIWQTYGYVHSTQERYPQAIEAFEKCLALGAMPPGALLDTQYNLGQLYMANRQYRKAIEVLTDWIGKVDKPNPETKHLLAMAHVQAKDWPGALPWMQQALAEVKEPREPWLQLLLSIHFELKQKAAIFRTLERLALSYPKKSYWMQLSAAALDLGDEKRALAILEMIHLQGLLQSGPELRNLASLLLQEGVPYKAAQVIARALEDGLLPRDRPTLTMLADAWLRARELERAVGPLGEAAALHENGDMFIRLAQVHMEREKWAEAAASIQAGQQKGKLTDPGNAQLLLGITWLRAERLDRARKAFEQAQGFDNTRTSAAQWLKALQARAAATPGG
jgi:tetratricopeptide (TPR) repeat protein